MMLVGERCPACSKFRNPAEILRFGQDGCVRMCLQCYEHHHEALQVLATQQPPKACQECGTSWEALSAGGNSKMYMHSKDGVYQVLCSRCSDAYERRRADLYRSTPYGAAKKI